MKSGSIKIYHYKECEPYRTKDGSIIRELVHPVKNDNYGQQSLAEATVDPGKETVLHSHERSEEIYHITGGCGDIVLGDTIQAIHPGDSILIPAGTAHRVKNTGSEPLVFLCCCSPPYRHEDTKLL